MNFEEPKVELIKFDDTDIIVTSGKPGVTDCEGTNAVASGFFN